MRNKPLSILLLVLFLVGCAPKKVIIIPAESPVPPPQPPTLTTSQLLGLKTPHGMISDPESGQFALKQVMESYWKLKGQAAQDGWHLILVSAHRT